jgi:hypothetical protein
MDDKELKYVRHSMVGPLCMREQMDICRNLCCAWSTPDTCIHNGAH